MLTRPSRRVAKIPFAFNYLFKVAHSLGGGGAENHVFLSRDFLLLLEAIDDFDEFIEIFELCVGSRPTARVEVEMAACWSSSEGGVVRCVIQDDDIAGFRFGGDAGNIVPSYPQILAERLEANFL